MILIQKDPPSADVSREINRVKRDYNWPHISKTDQETARNAFDQLDKELIRKQLLAEQKHLCAYCMRRIGEEDQRMSQPVSIEHWLPISADATKALDYDNMMLSCDGGRQIINDDEPHILSCDAAKGNKIITINPHNKDQMQKIRYDREGRIFVFPEDQELQNDIDHVLNLNGEIDPNGKMIRDTSSALVYSRRQAYQNYEEYIKRLGKKGKITAAILKKKIEEITSAEECMEFAGVWLFFLQRKLKSLG